MFTCPVCQELVETLTNYHCTSKHGMTKKEVQAQYGVTKWIDTLNNRAINNWLNSHKTITNADFEVAQRIQIKR